MAGTCPNLQEGLLVPNPIKVAVLGFWHVHAAEYADRVRQHPDTELVAVWDDDQDRGQAAAEDLDTAFFEDLGDLLARDDVDAVTVTAATSQHHRIMISAANAGKHIFTEKLLAPAVAEAEEIIAAADQAGVALVVSLPRLYHGYARTIVDQLNQGRLGKPTYCRVRLSHDGAIAGWLPERFYDSTAAIGGALSDLGCHPVYLAQLFLGTSPATVSATYASFTKRPAEDQAVVTLGYDGGAIGVAETGFLSRDPFTIEIHGTRATLAYDGTENLLQVRDARADRWQPVTMADDGADPFALWVAHIHNRTRADDNLARAVELSRLVVSANISAATETTVRYSIEAK